MAVRRQCKGPLATLTLLCGSIAWAHGCGIDLSDELAGRPCKNQVCLPGYVCSEANTCILDPGSGGDLGSGGSAAEGGTQGIGGSTEGAAGTGPDEDAPSDAPVLPDGESDRSNDVSGGSGGSAGSMDGGGNAGTVGSAGSDSGPNSWPGVGCHQLSCAPAEICCVRPFPGFMTLAAATAFSCKPPESECDFTLQCDGDHDCPTGEQCCATQTAGGWVASCAESCPALGIRVACTLPAHCRTGLLCCGDWNFQVNRFSSVSCSTICNGLSDRVLCSGEEDCGTSLNCLQSAAMPGFKTCQ